MVVALVCLVGLFFCFFCLHLFPVSFPYCPLGFCLDFYTWVVSFLLGALKSNHFPFKIYQFMLIKIQHKSNTIIYVGPRVSMRKFFHLSSSTARQK